MAICCRKPSRKLIFQTDRGSQYYCHDFQKLLEQCGILSSMSRKGDCWDNAVSESFFGILKTEQIHGLRYITLVHKLRRLSENRSRSGKMGQFLRLRCLRLSAVGSLFSDSLLRLTSLIISKCFITVSGTIPIWAIYKPNGIWNNVGFEKNSLEKCPLLLDHVINLHPDFGEPWPINPKPYYL